MAAKDAANKFRDFDIIDEVICMLAETLGRSSIWHDRFHGLQEILLKTFLEMQSIFAIRWLSRGEAILRLVANLPAAVLLLHEYDTVTYEVARGYKFHFCLFFLADLLAELNRLN
ncbi:hypothetical protein CLOP_g23751 [Closterium sp. NIES-67]|nr:hypothetical protein CLOP_g23751 [Closterium sp. NIES-67]